MKNQTSQGVSYLLFGVLDKTTPEYTMVSIFGGDFMFYSKKISYLDYCENGERIAGGGFLKTEFRGNELRLQMSVRGLRLTGAAAPEVILYSRTGEILLGQIPLENGQGEFRHECHIENGDTALADPSKNLVAFKVLLGENRELRCIWQSDAEVTGRGEFPQENRRDEESSESPMVEEAVKMPSVIKEPLPAETPKTEPPRTEAAWAQPSSTEGASTKAVPKERMLRVETREAEFEPREAAAETREAEFEPREVAAETVKKAPERPDVKVQTVIHLMEDKWRQISVIYPHVQPFQDDRDYLSITPADFVLFSADSYRAVNNSFLLHGYYNYKHLILTKVEQRGEVLYYLGVPGNYYDREKQVAVIFGFESFECAEEPAQEGDFGYYMMRVQL